MAKPLIFISHKHSDKEVATVIAKFIRDRSLGSVDVFLSSDWTFKGPRLGGTLTNELRKALWRTDVLILVYTSTDQDWSYCMWECGAATHPESPDTRTIVFQCGHEAPITFHSDLRVDVRQLDHIRKFTKEFLSDVGFFPNRNQALAPDIAQDTLENAATEMFGSLKKVIPAPPDGQVDEWPVWPFLRLELQQEHVETLEKLVGVNPSEQTSVAYQIVKEHGVVVNSDPRAAQLFGQNSFRDRLEFQELLTIWKQRFPTMDATWFESCCDQIGVGSRRKFPIVRQSPLRDVSGESDYTPVLSRVKRMPFAKIVQFDLYFYNLSDPQAVLATSRMIPLDKFFYKNLGLATPETINLKELVSELKHKGLNRVPVLNGAGHPLYIVHRSMIDKFVAENIWKSPEGNPASFTLADLLAEPEMKQLFEDTFVVISKEATVAAAKSAMLGRAGCSDVFVTENGKRNEPVIGWLTNVDIARNC